jgi:hypothetical protein
MALKISGMERRQFPRLESDTHPEHRCSRLQRDYTEQTLRFTVQHPFQSRVLYGVVSDTYRYV